MSANQSNDTHSLLDAASGPIRYKMTNDLMFKAVLQSNNHVLTGLVCALLHLDESAVKSAVVQNPIIPGETVDDKTVLLDVNLLLNNNTILDIEMQVEDEKDWVERSSYYLCRNYSNLESGQGYLDVKPSYHIGFLDYTLFPECPEFYATYLFMNRRTHQIYTDKLRISVIDLKHIDLATEEDRLYKIDQWARLFKATTWEELKMLSVSDSIWAEAGETILKVSADERMRQLIEAREDQRRRQIDAQNLFDKAIKERDDTKKELDDAKKELDDAKKARDDANAKLEAATAELNESKTELEISNAKNKENERRIADQDRQIAELERRLAAKS